MPTVVDSRSTLATDPLRNFRFQVNIPHTTPSGQRIIQLGFMTMDGLNLETQVIAYREGGFNTTALPLTAPVLTPSGWRKMGELEIGDRVIDPRGEDSEVLGIYPAGVKDTYEVTMQDDSTAVACYGHLWEVEVRTKNFRQANKPDIRIVSTLEMKALAERKGYSVLLPKIVPVNYDPQPDPLPLDPYLLGVLLAEGSFADSITLASTDNEVLDRVRAALPTGHRLVERSNGTSMCKYAISVGNDGVGARNVNGRNKVMAAIRELGLLGHRAWEKFIPERYLRASIQDRLDLLRGIMDGDGSIDARSGNVRFASSSEDLARGVRELIVSLGGRCKVAVETERTYTYKGSRIPCRDAWWIQGIGGLELNPFYLRRKADQFRPSTKSDSYMRKVVSVEHVGSEEVQCIEVSASSHLYISENWMPSHNTQKMPGQTDFTPITMTTGVIVARPHMWDWITEIFAVIAGTGPVSSNFRTNGQILVMSHPYTHNPVPAPLKVNVYNMWPSSFGISGLDAGGNAVLMEQIVLQNEGWQPYYSSAWNLDATAPSV